MNVWKLYFFTWYTNGSSGEKAGYTLYTLYTLSTTPTLFQVIQVTFAQLYEYPWLLAAGFAFLFFAV